MYSSISSLYIGILCKYMITGLCLMTILMTQLLILYYTCSCPDFPGSKPQFPAHKLSPKPKKPDYYKYYFYSGKYFLTEKQGKQPFSGFGRPGHIPCAARSGPLNRSILYYAKHGVNFVTSVEEWTMVHGFLFVESCNQVVASCVGMSFMEVTPWIMQRRRSLFGSLKV